MSSTRPIEASPGEQCIPSRNRLWIVLVIAMALLTAFGCYCFYYQTKYNFISTGLRSIGFGGAPWGLYIAFDIIFVGISFAGITVAALARLFHVKVLKPISRIAELITIVALLAGGCVIMADLGRPLEGLLKLPAYARPQSPFYGTFTLVIAGYLFSSFVFFLLAGRGDAARMAQKGIPQLRWLYRIWAMGYRDTPVERTRHHRASFWLSITILPLLVTAHSTLGFIFGLQVGRPGWYSALQAPGFIVLAGVSGTGVVILAGLGLRRLFSLHDCLPDSAFRWLGNFLWILASIYLYFMLVDELTVAYAGASADRHVAHSLTKGRYAIVFWTTVGSLLLTVIVPFVMYLRGRLSCAWLAVAAFLANVGAITKRILIVVPSQIEGVLIPVQPGHYTPNWVEWGIVVGLTAMIALCILVFARFFPVVPTSAPNKPKQAPPREVLRTLATALWATVSMGLLVFGLLDSFRVWSGAEADPSMPYSPVVFALGLMMLFSTAIVYEALPPRDKTDKTMEDNAK